MKPFSRVQKGKRLEQKLAALIRAKGLDDHAQRMPGSRPRDIRTALNYSFECKNTEKHNVWEEYEQARAQTKFNKPPVLVISGNYRPILAIVEIDTLLNLLKIEQDYLADIKPRKTK